MLHTSNSCFLEGGQKYKDIFFRVRNLITAFFENATWCPISKLKEIENGIKSILRVYTQKIEIQGKSLQNYRGIHLATVNGFSTELVLWH